MLSSGSRKWLCITTEHTQRLPPQFPRRDSCNILCFSVAKNSRDYDYVRRCDVTCVPGPCWAGKCQRGLSKHAAPFWPSRRDWTRKPSEIGSWVDEHSRETVRKRDTVRLYPRNHRTNHIGRQICVQILSTLSEQESENPVDVETFSTAPHYKHDNNSNLNSAVERIDHDLS